MTYETKNITFHVIHVKVRTEIRCSRTLPMNVATKIENCSSERNSCIDLVWSKMYGNHGRI